MVAMFSVTYVVMLGVLMFLIGVFVGLVIAERRY